MVKVIGTTELDASSLLEMDFESMEREEARWHEVERLQPLVLSMDSEVVNRTEFFAEPEEEQESYARWLRDEWADVRREERNGN